METTKDHNERALRITINNVRVRGDILRGGDTLLMIGVLHRVTHPSKCLPSYVFFVNVFDFFFFVLVILAINDGFDISILIIWNIIMK